MRQLKMWDAEDCLKQQDAQRQLQQQSFKIFAI